MIPKLLREIAEIEKQAEAINPKDKAALYSLLIVAYFKAKDIIVAQEEIVPEPIKVIDTDRIEELTYALEQSNIALNMAENARDAVLKRLEQVQLILSGKAGDDSEDHD